QIEKSEFRIAFLPATIWAGKMLVGEERSLLVRVAVAARSVAFEVLSTLPSPTSDATIPVGVVIAGEVPNTAAPVPVSLVRAAARFADVGVAKNVATPVPRPDTPVEMGSPVVFVRV